MSDVNETLQQLVDRRLREMGEERGRHEPLSLLEAYQAVAAPEVTYEVMRRVQKEGHRKLGARAVRTLATMLAVEPNEIREAAGQAPAGEPFVLPEKAAKLSPGQRKVVLSLVDEFVSEADAAAIRYAESLTRLMTAVASRESSDHYHRKYVIGGEEVEITIDEGRVRISSPTLDRISDDRDLYQKFQESFDRSLDKEDGVTRKRQESIDRAVRDAARHGETDPGDED